MGKTERRQYISTLQHFIDHNDTATFVVYRKEEQFTTNDFLTVVNDAQHCNETRALSKHFSHDMVLQLVEQYKESSDKVDAGRGNIFFDKGLCCSKNMGRSLEHYGLAVPRSRSVDTTMNSKDKEFCCMAERLLLDATKQVLPLKCKGKEKLLYSVPNTNKMFHTDTSKSFHATRYAVTNSENVLNVHVDSQNPSEHDGLNDSFMNMPVACFSVKKKDNRCSIIGYGRESIVSSSLRRLKFGPCISTIMRYYGELPEERKKITTDLVKQLSLEAIALNKPVRFSLHTNKMVTYSVYVD